MHIILIPPRLPLYLPSPVHIAPIPTEGWPGWVGLGGWLYTKMVYPRTVTHPLRSRFLTTSEQKRSDLNVLPRWQLIPVKQSTFTNIEITVFKFLITTVRRDNNNNNNNNKQTFQHAKLTLKSRTGARCRLHIGYKFPLVGHFMYAFVFPKVREHLLIHTVGRRRRFEWIRK